MLIVDVDTYATVVDPEANPSACIRNGVVVPSKCTGLTHVAVVLDDQSAEIIMVPNEHDKLLSFGIFEPVTDTTLPPEVAIPLGLMEVNPIAARDVNVSALLVKLPFAFTRATYTFAVDGESSDTIRAEL